MNINTVQNFPLIKEYNLDVSAIELYSESDIVFDVSMKPLIIEKILEAHKLALANVKAGNITGRGFASNVCTFDGYWSKGTNFNNTRNNISSICGERSAVISAYNDALIRFSNNPSNEFNFKIKYICMAQGVPLGEVENTVFPCEDCLSWINTQRYFSDDTLIFSFKSTNNTLSLYVQKISDLLPYYGIQTSSVFSCDKEIKYSSAASKTLYSEEYIKNIVYKNYEIYKNNSFKNISCQNVAAVIVANDEVFSSSKIDWTKRWFSEPLELCALKAIEKFGVDAKISLISYFGDETCECENCDGLVSIQTLGRIRQKYANPDTLLVLNLKDKVLVTTIGEYLPKKFIQGYKI